MDNIDNQANFKRNIFSKKNIIIVFIFFAILILVSVLTSLFLLNIDFNYIGELASSNPLKGINILYLIILIFSTIYFILWNALSVHIKSRHFKIKIKWWEWFLYSLFSMFLKGVTPISIGVEAYKLYWLYLKGLRPKQVFVISSTSSFYYPLIQIFLSLPSFGIISANYQYIASTTNGLIAYWFSFGGLLVDILVVSCFFIVSFSTKIQYFLVLIWNKILKLFKQKYKNNEQIREEIIDKEIFKEIYLKEIRKISDNLYLILGFTIYLLLEFFNMYFVFQIIGIGNYVTFSDIYNYTSVSVVANNFIPIPGAEGTIQYILSNFFSIINNYQSDQKKIDTAVFVWRSFDFYLPTILGLLSVPFVLYIHFHKKRIKE